jgi:type I restriction enzyme, R subunit
MKKHTEARLNEVPMQGLTFVDYCGSKTKERYDRARALDPVLVMEFIQRTQPKLWQSLRAMPTL